MASSFDSGAISVVVSLNISTKMPPSPKQIAGPNAEVFVDGGWREYKNGKPKVQKVQKTKALPPPEPVATAPKASGTTAAKKAAPDATPKKKATAATTTETQVEAEA